MQYIPRIMQNIPRIMQAVHTVDCGLVPIDFNYPSGLFYWHCYDCPCVSEETLKDVGK